MIKFPKPSYKVILRNTTLKTVVEMTGKTFDKIIQKVGKELNKCTSGKMHNHLILSIPTLEIERTVRGFNVERIIKETEKVFTNLEEEYRKSYIKRLVLEDMVLGEEQEGSKKTTFKIEIKSPKSKTEIKAKGILNSCVDLLYRLPELDQSRKGYMVRLSIYRTDIFYAINKVSKKDIVGQIKLGLEKIYEELKARNDTIEREKQANIEREKELKKYKFNLIFKIPIKQDFFILDYTYTISGDDLVSIWRGVNKNWLKENWPTNLAIEAKLINNKESSNKPLKGTLGVIGKQLLSPFLNGLKDDTSVLIEKLKTMLKDSLECSHEAVTYEDQSTYTKRQKSSICDYCKNILENSIYPITFKKQIELFFNTETKILVIDYLLPSPDTIPNIKEIKYIQNSHQVKEIFFSKSDKGKLFDLILYQITLRSIYELYQVDLCDVLNSIVFNGWIQVINKSTGQDEYVCVLSLHANREEFLKINLSRVEPKDCFKALKGIGGSKLYGLVPIVPIIQIDREDRRFVTSYSVSAGLDESFNIAAMNWKDFENLIRELFEQEFSHSGGEVKITQASRDGGVDAIAFDLDPIRGGKIVIQAKRYTNIVGVSAVRDLYGTVVNEGATKGILVTTSDYGPDAYEFAKGKPLTLLNGGNLLYLLEKHGHRAIIDIKEAKRILAEQDS